ncbi:MAG: SWIM zinc finger family protein [Tepidisphaeraceae bacterium]
MASASGDRQTPKGHKQTPGNGWASLTWDILDQWAGSRSVSRGRAYQKQGRVTDLAMSDSGRLLATVAGGERYTTSVWLNAGKTGRERIESKCTCPVGYNGCKHAVAVVAAYLDLLAHEKEVAVADAEDPRWGRLSGEDLESESDAEDEIEDDEDESEAAKPAKPHRARTDWDQKIRQHIEAKSREELAEFVWSLTERFPELREEFQERIALGEGDVDRLLKQARQELRRVTAETGWGNEWTDEGHTPDYSRLKHRLERLVELGHCDAVVTLGQELIERGVQQVEQSHDEGETSSAIAECLPLVFKAVAGSSLSAPRKLLFAIDAYLKDDYDLIADTADPVMDAEYLPQDWSAVADELARRIRAMPGGSGDDFSRNYKRDQIVNWLVNALDKAGRGDEVLAIYETEARITGSYERLVKILVERKCYEDAERWATEGIGKTREKLPGIASHLADALCEVARLREQWAVVAAHAAWRFFDQPHVTSLKTLLAAADKAGCQDRVRQLALQFLETGVAPIRIVTSRNGEYKADVVSEWPLPVPGFVLQLHNPKAPLRSRVGPRMDVLIDLAIDEKRPDDVLRWYDKFRSDRKQSANHFLYGQTDRGDSVAEAVAKSHPERALAIYAERVNEHLTQASHSAYETVAAYLRKMRPILKSLGREQEWIGLLADIRLKHRNRPRFMEVLDRLEDRTVLETQKRKR